MLPPFFPLSRRTPRWYSYLLHIHSQVVRQLFFQAMTISTTYTRLLVFGTDALLTIYNQSDHGQGDTRGLFEKRVGYFL